MQNFFSARKRAGEHAASWSRRARRVVLASTRALAGEPKADEKCLRHGHFCSVARLIRQ
jgi:hypothetical protein